LLGGILPDVDMLYFYLIDHRQHFHHTYWTHLPFCWAMVVLLVWIAYWRNWVSQIFFTTLSVVVFNVFLHLALDSIAGGILWLWPFSNKSYSLVDVPSLYSHWILNFVFHWTFVLEILLTLVMIFVLWRGSQKRVSPLLAD